MDHQPFTREVPGSRTAVVLIHGIVGTPDHFDFLLPAIPEEMSLYCLLLDGHGGTVQDFAQTSMEKWRAQVCRCLDELQAKYDRVILVAHSMGTLFSIQEALQRPKLIAGLFLLAVPLYPFVRPDTAAAAVKLALGKATARDKIAMEMAADCSVALTPKLWQYLSWLPRFWELMVQCRRTRQLLPQLRTPTLAFQSRRDELVALRSRKPLEKNPAIRCLTLESSGHFAYSTQEQALLLHHFRKLLSQLLPQTPAL